MSTENLQAIYSVMYKPCPGCLSYRINLYGYSREVCLENPATEEEIPGWVTTGPYYCNYCMRVVRIAGESRTILGAQGGGY